ncbi:MAG: hypothetical protein U0T84_13420 [Chitinophagales bacterium]
MKFADILDHTEVKDKLSHLIAEGRLPHALLLLGQEGCGALPMALAIAQNLVCEKRHGKKASDDLFAAPSMFGDAPAASEQLENLRDACGTCPACHKANQFIHPDIHFTFPAIKTDKKKEGVSAEWITEWRKALHDNPYLGYSQWLTYLDAENKQGNIPVKECHEIIRQLNLKTFESNFKIQIIWMAEFLGGEGNTLLKTLEEPPENTVIILVAENAEMLLNTILSRTQIIKLNAIDDHLLGKFLQSKFDMPEADALRIARISDGNVNAAFDYAEGAAHPTERMLRDWLSACLRMGLPKHEAEASEKIMSLTDQFAKAGREGQKVFLKYFLWFLREVNLLRVGVPSQKLEGAELEFGQKLAGVITTAGVSELERAINDLHYHVTRNANPKIVFTATSVKLARALRIR